MEKMEKIKVFIDLFMLLATENLGSRGAWKAIESAVPEYADIIEELEGDHGVVSAALTYLLGAITNLLEEVLYSDYFDLYNILNTHLIVGNAHELVRRYLEEVNAPLDPEDIKDMANLLAIDSNYFYRTPMVGKEVRYGDMMASDIIVVVVPETIVSYLLDYLSEF